MLYTRFVKTGLFSLSQLINWMAVQPAALFGLNAGQLTEGAPADLALFDLSLRHLRSTLMISYLGHNSPFIGEQALGKTVRTIVSGQDVYPLRDID